MKYKIAIFGSAKTNLSKRIYNLAERTGEELAKTSNILITGAAEGISQYAAKGAKKEKGYVIGISPTRNERDKKNYGVNFDFIDKVVHTGLGYKGRNVISVRKSDGIIVINGGFGTLNEVTIAEGESKPIVVVENSGGTSNLLRFIFRKLNPGYKKVAFVSTPEEAVITILKLINKR